jgi:putative inorganic carbon (HCO3(-)) transporter
MDLGWPGLTAYVAMLISVIFVLVRVYRRSGDPVRRMLAVGILGSVVAMLVHGISDAVTWGTKLSFLPWMLFALAMLVARRQRDEIV